MKATSVVDVILGEAKAGNFADMLAIASVISNRANELNTTQQNVVSVKSEFNAYGKALPPGVNQYRGLAELAVKTVEKKGPVTNATFYATPSASKNLPSGLKQVYQTDGHVYFTDPQNRSIKTADGFKTPSGQLQQIQTANVPTPTSRDVALAMDATTGANPATAYGPSAFNGSTAQGLLAEMGSSVPAPSASVSISPSRSNTGEFNVAFGPERNQMPTSNIGAIVADAARSVDPTIGTTMYSGMEPIGADPVGSDRHTRGLAGDFFFTDENGKKISDQGVLQDIAMATAAQTKGGVGFGHEYMGLYGMHLDLVDKNLIGPGQGMQWGSLGREWADELDYARSTGIGPTPRTDAPMPSSRAEALAANNADIDDAKAARNANNATSSNVAGQYASYGAGKLGMAAPAVAAAPSPSPVADVQASASIGAPEDESSATVTGGILSPEQKTAAAYGQMAASMKDTGLLGISGAKAVPNATARAVPALAPVAAKVAPVAVARPAPVQVAPRQSAPVSSAPTPSATPMATAMDVYNGKANIGVASNGAMLSRNSDGTITYNSDKYGWSQLMSPSGNVIGFHKDGSPFNTATSAGTGIGGAIGSIGKGISGIFGGGLTNISSTGLMAGLKGASMGASLGGIPGAVAGGLLGLAAGNKLASANQNGGLLSGILGNRGAPVGTVTYTTPTGKYTAYQAQAGLGYPEAPSGGILGGSNLADGWSYSDAAGISPGAADALSSGSGGLY